MRISSINTTSRIGQRTRWRTCPKARASPALLMPKSSLESCREGHAHHFGWNMDLAHHAGSMVTRFFNCRVGGAQQTWQLGDESAVRWPIPRAQNLGGEEK